MSGSSEHHVESAAPSSDACGVLPSDSLLVQGLPANYTEQQVREIFEMYGFVVSSSVLEAGVDHTTALVKMTSVDEASWLVQNLNANIPQGLQNPVTVSFADGSEATKRQPGTAYSYIGTGDTNLSSSRAAPYGNKGSKNGKKGAALGLMVLPNGTTIDVLGKGTLGQSVVVPHSDINAKGIRGQTDGLGGITKGVESKGMGGDGKGMKLRLCSFFTDTGSCPQGSQCTFAHGPHEIRNYKVRLCRLFPSGTCPQGDKCSFAHGIQEIQVRQEPGSMDASSASAMNPAGTVSSQLPDLQAGLNFHNAFGALGIDIGVLSVLSQLLTSTQQPPAASAHGLGAGQTN